MDEEIIAKIQKERCIACGLCELKAPTIFTYDEEGLAYFRNTHSNPHFTERKIEKSEHAAFLEAYRHCPTGAITRKKQARNL